MEVFGIIAGGISIAGSIIIIWGVLITLYHSLSHEIMKVKDKASATYSETIRHQFTSYLLLGLDFMLAADIIHTIHNPVLNELYILAFIVGIRSVISFFLVKEMKGINSERIRSGDESKNFKTS